MVFSFFFKEINYSVIFEEKGTFRKLSFHDNFFLPFQEPCAIAGLPSGISNYLVKYSFLLWRRRLFSPWPSSTAFYRPRVAGRSG